MMRSLYSGVSGLRNHQTRMDVIGNNIANINTFGFKSGRVAFSDIMSQTLRNGTTPGSTRGGVNPIQIGLGVSVASVGERFLQGSIMSTGITTDLAIQGDAFFVVSDGNADYYTRTNMFQFDGSGRLVDPSSGLVLQGTMADDNGDLVAPGSLGDIALPFGQEYPAKATGDVTWTGNLDASISPLESILQSSRVLAVPEDTDDIFSMYNGDGINLDLNEGDQVYFRSLASDGTTIDQLYNGSHTSLGLQFGESLVISGLLDDIESGILDPGDFSTSEINFDLTVEDLQAGTGATNYGIAIPPLNGKTVTQAVDAIVEAFKASGAPVKVVDEGSTYRIEPLNQTTQLSYAALPDLSTIGLDPVGETTTPQYTEVTFGTGVGEMETLGDLVATLQTELNTTAGFAGSEITVIQEDNGSIRIQNDHATDDIHVEIRTVGENATFTNAIRELQGEVDAGDRTSRSDAFTFQSSFIAGDDFNDLNDLAGRLERAMQEVSATATVVVTTDGKLDYGNVSGAGVYAIRDMEIAVEPSSRSVFERALGLDSEDLDVNASLLSDRFLRVATGDDALTDLYSTSGKHLGLNTGDTIEVDATIGGEEITPAASVIGTEITTYEDLADFIETTLDIRSGDGVSIQSNGSLYIDGDPGEEDSLDSIAITEAGNSVLSDALAFNTLQEAKNAIAVSSVIAYDSLGNAHTVVLTFNKSEIENYWTWEATVDGDATLLRGNHGTATFNEDGTLAGFASTDGSPLSFEPGTGAAEVVIDFDAGTLGGLDGLTQFASASTVVASDQDGYGKGDLASITIDEYGVVKGHYTNSISKTLAQIYLASFNNPGGLRKEGENLYTAGANSGDPVIGTAGAAIAATVVSGGLEQSNVDMAEEFTNLITTQRGFQASTRIITTADEMLVDTLGLKR
jgi:flagellar hook protein FlgE